MRAPARAAATPEWTHTDRTRVEPERPAAGDPAPRALSPRRAPRRARCGYATDRRWCAPAQAERPALRAASAQRPAERTQAERPLAEKTRAEKTRAEKTR